MKNNLYVLVLVVAITIPQIASASWWDLFSWKIFSRISKPRIEKIEQIATSTNTTNHDDEIERLKTEIEELKNQKTKNSQAKTQTKKEITPSVDSQIKTTISNTMNITYVDIVKKYIDFQTIITNERSGLKKNSTISTERAYITYLDDILNKINSDLGYLESIKYWSVKPVGIEGTYLEKFNKIKDDYDLRIMGYRVDFEEEKTTTAQQNMEELKKQADNIARKNSPECLKWTSILKEIKEQIKPLQSIKDKRWNEYLTIGKYVTPDLSSSDSNKLTDLMLRESSVMSEYYYTCEGFVPSSPKTTTCNFIGNTMYCQ